MARGLITITPCKALLAAEAAHHRAGVNQVAARYSCTTVILPPFLDNIESRHGRGKKLANVLLSTKNLEPKRLDYGVQDARFTIHSSNE